MNQRHAQTEPRLHETLRRRAGALIVDNVFRGLATAGKLHPLSRPERHRVEVLSDIPYQPGEARHHHLDIYRPTGQQGKLPIILYVHGGGFRILSKDTHWVMALSFARRGYLVFNINYRLAPEHPYPAAIQDCCAALAWVAQNAHRYGGDIGRLAFAGESAGANLVTALALATSYSRPEPWAQSIYDLDLRPRAVLPACGMLQVTDPHRFRRRKAKIATFIHDRLLEVSEAYLGRGAPADALDLADPLVFLERGTPPSRPLPPFFVPVGTKDPLLDDSRRLKAALDNLGTPCDVRYYPGEIHAFHALVWRPNAQACWRHTFEFLDQYLSLTTAA